MAVNLMGGSKFKMPKQASSEDVSRIVEKGQKAAAGGGGSSNWNVSVCFFFLQPLLPLQILPSHLFTVF